MRSRFALVMLVGLSGCGPTLGEVQQREKPFVDALKLRLQAALEAVAAAPDAPAEPTCPQVSLRYDSSEPSSKFFKGRNVELWSDLVLQQQLTGKQLPTEAWFGKSLGQPSNTSALGFALYLPTESRAELLAEKAGPIVAPTLEAAKQVTHLVVTRQVAADLGEGIVTVDTFLVSLADARVLCGFRVAPRVDPKDQGSLVKTVRVYGGGRREDVGTNTYGGFGIGMTSSLRNGISDGIKKHFTLTASGEPLPVDLFR